MEAMDVRSAVEPGQQDRTEEVRRPGAERDGANSDWGPPWLGGAVLILIGAVFLLRNVTGVWFDDWWALFIAIPGVIALASAWRIYQRNGARFDGRVLGAALGGVFPLLVAAIFLLDLDWGRVWPLFLIAAGLLAMAPRNSGKKQVNDNGE